MKNLLKPVAVIFADGYEDIEADDDQFEEGEIVAAVCTVHAHKDGDDTKAYSSNC